MLRIRLSRIGKKRQPSYRVVVADVDAKRDGRIVERIGHYNPRAQTQDYSIQEDRALYWLSVGAQPSDAVRRLLEKQGTYDRLGRLRGGESFETLVAEYKGTELPLAEMAQPETSSAMDVPGDVVALPDVMAPTDVVAEVEDMADVEAAAAVAAVAEMTEAMALDETIEEE
jgi:small subunit ribosomal protein S16